MLHAKALHLISQISASFRGFFFDFWYTNGVSMAMYAWVLLKTFPGKRKEKCWCCFVARNGFNVAHKRLRYNCAKTTLFIYSTYSEYIILRFLCVLFFFSIHVTLRDDEVQDDVPRIERDFIRVDYLRVKRESYFHRLSAFPFAQKLIVIPSTSP